MGAGLVPSTSLDNCRCGQHSGVTCLISAQKLLLGHEAVLGLQFLRGRLVFHGRRGVDRRHGGWSRDGCHGWGGHKSCRTGASSHMSGRKEPRTPAGDNEGRLHRFPTSPSKRCERPLLAESGSQ